jgi:hypothetical protein
VGGFAESGAFARRIRFSAFGQGIMPAMEADLAHHVWTVEQRVAIMPETVAKKRSTYKKRLAALLKCK